MAKDSSISPWVRPSLLSAVGFMALGVAFLSGVIDAIFDGVGIRFGSAVMQVAAKTPEPLFELFGWMFTVYGLGKSGEKMVSHYRKPELMEAQDDAQEGEHNGFSS